MQAGSIQTRLLGILAIGISCSVIACSGGGGGAAATAASSSAVVVQVAPSSPNVAVNSGLPVRATITGVDAPDLIWTVDGVEGGNAAVGTILGTGANVTYMAPDASGTHVVQASLRSNPSKSGSATVEVTAFVAVSITPAGATVPLSGSQAFSASVINTSDSGVVWTVDDIPGGNSSVGTLVVAGATATYSAPASAGVHTLKATSTADGSKSATASISVQESGAVSLVPAAFPGCEGMGCGATGGRGGVVYTVNTLEDSTNPGAVPGNGPNGPRCSLRDAMTKSGARTIVFSVGGTIVLHSSIYPVPPNLTIAGQTAPGGGIQITGDGTFGSGGALL
ncbi:MAG TPA: hypothetical protein VJ623_10365, partial [Holophagaceae bacterium]|nr:hypothetical protein [Holophagaceae bacterium]